MLSVLSFQFWAISRKRIGTRQRSETTLEKVVHVLMSRTEHKMVVRVSMYRRMQKWEGYN